MKAPTWSIVAVLLTSWPAAFCPGQQAAGPATLENLLVPATESSPGNSATTVEAGALPERPAGRPQGSLVRPSDGVQHPDLDKAWAAYDEAAAKIAQSVKAAIAKQFDAATDKGDLDGAEKWQAIGLRFEEAGVLPAETEIKGVVSTAVASHKKASEELNRAYAAVVKSLTVEKKIAEAKAVRSESQLLIAEMQASDVPEDTVPDRVQRPTVAHGLLGEYFSDSSGRNKVYAQTDEVLSFDWGRGAPKGLPPDDFFVRWSGFVVPPQTGEYRFAGTSDDGCRFVLDGRVVFSDMRGRNGEYLSDPIHLTAGKRHRIVIEYFEKGWGASFTWQWIKPDGVRQQVPSRCLIPAASVPR